MIKKIKTLAYAVYVIALVLWFPVKVMNCKLVDGCAKQCKRVYMLED